MVAEVKQRSEIHQRIDLIRRILKTNSSDNLQICSQAELAETYELNGQNQLIECQKLLENRIVALIHLFYRPKETRLAFMQKDDLVG